MNYFKQFINDILTEISYRTNEGVVNLKNKDHEIITIDKFYHLRSFEDYRKCLGSDLTFDYKKKNWLVPKIWLDKTSLKEEKDE